MEWFKQVVSSDSAVSSARLINITGAITGFLLIMFDTIKSGTIDNTAFGIYLGYCAGVYATGKGLGIISNTNKEKSDD